MRASIPLFLLVAGCWPRIPGSWDDYAEGDTDTDTDTDADLGPDDAIVGVLEWGAYRGDYWEATSDGDVFFTTMVIGLERDSTSTYADTWPLRGQCGDLDEITWPWTSLADIGAAGSIGIQGTGGTFELAWIESANLFASQPDPAVNLRTGGSYTVESFEVPGATIEAFGVDMPPARSLTYPEIDGASVATWDPATPASWTTSGAGDVLLGVTLVNGNGDTLERRVCRVNGANGSFRFPNGTFTRMSSAVAAYFEFHTFVETPSQSVTASGGGDLQVGGHYIQVGFVALP